MGGLLNNSSKIPNLITPNEIFKSLFQPKKANPKAFKLNYKDLLSLLENSCTIALQHIFNKNDHLNKYDFYINDKFFDTFQYKIINFSAF